MREGRAELADGDPDTFDPFELQELLGDALRDALDELVLLGLDDALGHRHGPPVVDGVGQVVGETGSCEVGLEVEVDLEGLGPVLLLRVDADLARWGLLG